MTLPRWWNDRFMLRLVLTTLVINGVAHLLSFVPGGAPSALGWTGLLCWGAVTLGQFQLRHPQPQLPAPPPAPRGSLWQQLRAEFTTGPLWLRLFNWSLVLILCYMLLSLVLLVVNLDGLNGIFRINTLLAVNACLLWLRTRLLARQGLAEGPLS